MGIQTPGHTQTPVCRPGWGSQQLCAPKHLCVAAFQVPWSLKAIMQVALFHAVSLKSQWLGNLQLKPTLAHMRTVNLCLGSCTADASQILQAPRSPSWQSRSQRRPTSLQNRAKPTQLALATCTIARLGLQTPVCSPGWDSKHPCVAPVGDPNAWA